MKEGAFISLGVIERFIYPNVFTSRVGLYDLAGSINVIPCRLFGERYKYGSRFSFSLGSHSEGLVDVLGCRLYASVMNNLAYECFEWS